MAQVGHDVGADHCLGHGLELGVGPSGPVVHPRGRSAGRSVYQLALHPAQVAGRGSGAICSRGRRSTVKALPAARHVTIRALTIASSTSAAGAGRCPSCASGHCIRGPSRPFGSSSGPRLGANGLVAEVHRVQIHVQDLALEVGLIGLDGQDRPLDLPVQHGRRALDEPGLDQLLGDRLAALAGSVRPSSPSTRPGRCPAGQRPARSRSSRPRSRLPPLVVSRPSARGDARNERHRTGEDPPAPGHRRHRSGCPLAPRSFPADGRPAAHPRGR